jgi:glycosyltransferase involved in cell wall biosynthesis
LRASTGRKISVLHLIQTVAYGGVETAVINWLRRVDRTRFDVHLVCFANPGNTEGPFVEAAERQGLKVLKIPWSRRKPFFKAARCVALLVSENHVDILHTHNAYANWVGLITRWLVPVKIITTQYVWEKLEWKRNVQQSVDRWLIGYFDMVSAHCEKTYEQTKAFGIPPSRLRTLICGYESQRAADVSAEERSRNRRQRGIEDGHVLIANVARLYPEKAQDFLMKCFRRVLQRRPEARLWILGLGPSEEYLKKYCSDLGLDDSVQFLGFVSDLAPLLSLVDIQVDPARAAGVSLAICSGMAAGLPIIAADVGGLDEVLKQDRTGIRVQKDDEDAFVEAMLRLVENRAERLKIGAAARDFIENDYSLDSAVKRVEAVYCEMMESAHV